MISVELGEAVVADVIEGLSIPSIPRWSLSEGKVTLGLFYSYAEWESHRLDSIGSIDPTEITQTDEVLFHPRDRLLWGVRLGDSNYSIPFDTLPTAWDKEKTTHGLLRLCSAARFLLDSRRVYWIAPDGELFTSLYETALTAKSENILRLRLASDFDLLFAGGRLCGWMLAHPARYLSDPWEKPDLSVNATDDKLPALLYDCIHLVDAPRVKRMDDRDLDTLQEMKSLSVRIDPFDNAIGPRLVLRRYMEELIDKYYF